MIANFECGESRHRSGHKDRKTNRHQGHKRNGVRTLSSILVVGSCLTHIPLSLLLFSSMRDSSVLIIGLSGLACEISKNIVLAGIGSLVLLDDAIVTGRDLSANFLLTEQDIGKNVRGF